MNAYRVGWLITALALGLLGILAAAAASPPDLLAEFVAFAVIGVLVVLVVSQTDHPRGGGHRARGVAFGAGIAGSSAGAILGWTTIVGAAAIALALVVTVTSPWAVRAIGRWWHTRSGPSADHMEAVVQTLASSGLGFVPFQMVPPEPPATDEQLCRDWCESYRALRATYSGRKFVRIVEDRKRYLDEFERRNREGFAAWLASGASADDNPLPYLSLNHIDRAEINWDELIEGHDS